MPFTSKQAYSCHALKEQPYSQLPGPPPHPTPLPTHSVEPPYSAPLPPSPVVTAQTHKHAAKAEDISGEASLHSWGEREPCRLRAAPSLGRLCAHAWGACGIPSRKKGKKQTTQGWSGARFGKSKHSGAWCPRNSAGAERPACRAPLPRQPETLLAFCQTKPQTNSVAHRGVPLPLSTRRVAPMSLQAHTPRVSLAPAIAGFTETFTGAFTETFRARRHGLLLARRQPRRRRPRPPTAPHPDHARPAASRQPSCVSNAAQVSSAPFGSTIHRCRRDWGFGGLGFPRGSGSMAVSCESKQAAVSATFCSACCMRQRDLASSV